MSKKNYNFCLLYLVSCNSFKKKVKWLLQKLFFQFISVNFSFACHMLKKTKYICSKKTFNDILTLYIFFKLHISNCVFSCFQLVLIIKTTTYLNITGSNNACWFRLMCYKTCRLRLLYYHACRLGLLHHSCICNNSVTSSAAVAAQCT